MFISFYYGNLIDEQIINKGVLSIMESSSNYLKIEIKSTTMKRFIITNSSQQMRRLRTITSSQNVTVTKQVSFQSMTGNIIVQSI